jgi:glycyl-tRNA synthetase beta chain
VAALSDHFAAQSVTAKLTGLLDLRTAIDAYFDENMIMADDEQVRDNRLKQLKKLSNMILSVANLDALIVK